MGGEGGVCVASVTREAQADMLQTWQTLTQVRKKRGKRNWRWLREGLEPTTWQMAYHALTNWATESPGNSVAEFEYLRLSCQGSSRSRYQAGMSDGEGMASAKCEAQAQIFWHAPDLTGLNPSQSQWESSWGSWRELKINELRPKTHLI